MAVRVGIYGAGAIGGYVGVKLSAAGLPVVLIGRSALVECARALEAVDVRGATHRPHELEVSTDARALAGVDLCLVTVKSRDTEAAAESLAGVLRAECAVISLQNGLSSARTLRRVLGGSREVAGGVVGFNVFRDGPARFRQATSGAVLVGPTSRSERLVRALVQSGEQAAVRRDIERVMAGKLLLNLNNGVCAATGLGIAASLRDRDARWLFSRCIVEGLRALAADGLTPARVAPLGPRAIASLMALPDVIVHRMARVLIRVDEGARSSTLQDLERGHATEIDELNGAIVALAEKHGLRAPANRAVAAVVRELERAVLAGEPLRFVTPSELRRRVTD